MSNSNSKIKNVFKYIILVACIGLLIFGIISLSRPNIGNQFTYESFMPTYRTVGNNLIIQVEVENNSGKTDEAVFKGSFEIHHRADSFIVELESESKKLVEDDNIIEFVYSFEGDNFFSPTCSEVKNLQISIDGSNFEKVKEDGLFFSGISFLPISCIVIGVMGIVAWLSLNVFFPKVSRKLEAVKPANILDTFETRIKNAFNNDKKDENKKIVCTYCKCQFDSKFDKCPHCGAPPERKD